MHILPDRISRIGLFAGLCWLFACIHFDRQILSILADSVKSDLHIGDSALGALTGSAFSLVYALLGLHFGRISDTADRLVMVRTGACVWSFATLGAAASSGYAELVLARAGVALGEAIASVAAVSLMADLAGESYRARASSVFFSCAFLGPGLAAIVGGLVLHALQDSQTLVGWRVALIVAALPGLLGAAYLSLYRWRDSARAVSPRAVQRRGITIALVGASALGVAAQASLPPTEGAPAAVGLALCAAAMWALALRRQDPLACAATIGHPVFRCLLIGFAGILFIDCAAGFWLLPYAQRRFSVGAGAAGTLMGALMIAGGILGAIAGGLFSDRWQQVRPTGRMWTAFLSVLAETALLLLALVQSDYRHFIAVFAGWCMASGLWTGVTAAIGMDIVPREYRGTAVAAYYLVTTILGPALGPFIAGMLSVRFGSIGASLAACCSVILISIAAFARMLVLSGRSAQPGMSGSTRFASCSSDSCHPR